MNSWVYDVRVLYPPEGQTLIGNGYIGGSLPIDGHGAAGNSMPGVAVGLYAGEEESPANIPHWLNIPIRLDGETIRLSPVGFRQQLDLRRGIFSTHYRDNTGAVVVEVETFCHRQHRHLGAYRLTIHALREISLELLPQLQNEFCSPPTISTVEPSAETTVAWRLGRNDAAADVYQSLALVSVSANVRIVKSIDRASIGFRLSRKLPPGESVMLEVAVAVAWGPDAEATVHVALADAIREGYSGLFESHVQAMARLWNHFDISIGDPFLERKIKGSMFYLLSGYRDDVAFGGTATGVSSSQVWGGSVFWDVEFYMFPALLTFFPNLARNTLLYRHSTLPAALANAQRHGEAGARFAWQSKRSGKPFGGAFEDERHITTDVAFAAWWYGNASADVGFQKGSGKELILAAARNVASRLTWNESAQRYEIHSVIPPDEHVLDHHVGTPIDNSAMTNAYAKWVLATAAELLGPSEAKEASQWQSMAERLYQPRDSATGIIPEYDGYNGHSIKQADIGHVFFPLNDPIDPQVLRRSVYYYADRERETGLYLTHSPSVYAAALAKVGDVAGVGRFLELAGRNSVGPFEVPRESNYGGPPVVTGAGSFINLLVFGIVGMESLGSALSAHPCVPKQVGRVELRGVHFRGRRYRIIAEPGVYTATIEPL
jgi:trehalose/maltose hydrolase-like predicted phosphorylase